MNSPADASRDACTTAFRDLFWRSADGLALYARDFENPGIDHAPMLDESEVVSANLALLARSRWPFICASAGND